MKKMLGWVVGCLVLSAQTDEQPRAYKTWGSKELKTWEEVTEGQEADYNFFKVSVEMPE